MTDTVTAALIGVAGAVVVAVVTVATQLGVTRAVIRSERDRVQQRITGEERSRRKDRREERLLDAVSELLAVSDPQAALGPEYGKAVVLIHRIQLLLDLGLPGERSLNGAVNQLGKRLHEYHFVRDRHIDDKLPETQALLEAHSSVSDLTRAVLKRVDVAAT